MDWQQMAWSFLEGFLPTLGSLIAKILFMALF